MLVDKETREAADAYRDLIERALDDGVENLPRDLDGDPYRDNGIGPWKVTHCCGAYAKGCEDGIRCRSCFALLDLAYDGPARL